MTPRARILRALTLADLADQLGEGIRLAEYARYDDTTAEQSRDLVLIAEHLRRAHALLIAINSTTPDTERV